MTDVAEADRQFATWMRDNLMLRRITVMGDHPFAAFLPAPPQLALNAQPHRAASHPQSKSGSACNGNAETSTPHWTTFATPEPFRGTTPSTNCV